MNGPLLIVAAVEGELAGLGADLREPRESSLCGRHFRAGWLHGVPVRLLVSGPGMANAVQATAVAAARERPGAILTLGCAGAFADAGLGVGDVALADMAVELHLGLEPADGGIVPDPLPFPVLPENDGEPGTSAGRYPCHGPWLREAAAVLGGAFAGKCGFAVGPILTVSTVTTSDARAAALFHRLRPVMEAMEGAGVAHVAAVHRIPFLELRAAANFVGRRERERWNLPLAFERCAEAVRRMLAAGAVPGLGVPATNPLTE